MKLKSWQEITEIMRGQGLHFVTGYEIIEVIYGGDGARRYIILRTDKGYYTYQSESLIAFDEDELRYLPADSLPAYWQPASASHQPIFEDLTELKRELYAEPEYMTYFIK